MRHYQRGKHVLEQLGGKTMVMTLLGHADPNVRYAAIVFFICTNILQDPKIHKNIRSPG